MLLVGAQLVLESRAVELGWIRADEGRIVEMGEGAPPGVRPGEELFDLSGRTIVPGFIDVHTHGGGGASFTGGDGEDVTKARRFHLLNGTTRCLASLVTAPVAHLVAALESLAELTKAGVIAGTHLEGPFLSPHNAGAQDRRHMLAPDARVLDRLLNAGGGTVRMVTIAPELPGAVGLVRQLSAAGVIPAIGHSAATYREASTAIDAGARVATHLWNAMRTLDHREPGIVGASLAREEVACELIVDGHHLHPEVIALTRRLAADRVAFVSDASSAAGRTDGRYHLGELEIDIRDGRSFLAGTDTIAGSTVTLAESVRLAVREGGFDLVGAVQAASATPARLLGMSDELGAIRPGFLADLAVLDEDLRVQAVLAEGRWQRLAANAGSQAAGLQGWSENGGYSSRISST
jgi:N-acetylglucosamine-6-phosphate deacetylase